MIHKSVDADSSEFIKMENPAHGVNFKWKTMYTMSVMCFTSNFFFI